LRVGDVDLPLRALDQAEDIAHAEDAHRHALRPLFQATYGRDAQRWWARWRVFFMAVSELFGFDRGRQWWVSHYLFERRA